MSQLCIPAGMPAPGVSELNDIVDRSDKLKKGTLLYRRGDECTSVYAVMHGAVKTTLVNDDGVKQITGFYMPGEMFGFGGLADNIHTRQAETLCESVICELPLQHIDDLSSSMQVLQTALRSMMGFELRREQQQVMMLGKMNAEQKLAVFLLDIAERVFDRHHVRREFDMAMTRQDMANYLGLAVETLSRLFHQFEQRGLLATSRRHINILDMESLLELAGDFAPAKR